MSARNSGSSFERRLVHRLEGHEGAVLYCAVDPKEETLATCSVDGRIILWSIATGENLITLKGVHTGEVTSCAFCSIGPILASSSRDKKVILWQYNIKERKGKRASRLELHSDAVLHCAFSKDGKFLASASRDKTARVYKIRPGAGEFVPGGDVTQLVGHTAAVNCIQIRAAPADDSSKASAVALTGSDDRTIRVWRQDNDWKCGTTLSGFTAPVKSVIFSPVDPVFASLAGNRVTVWRTVHGNTMKENDVDIRSTKQLKAISFIPDGRYIVGVASDATINIWDSTEQNEGKDTWSNTRSDDREHEGEILTCCFAKRNLITADVNGVACVWEPSLV
ncbi:uncharacterized protein LOC144646485 isoform X2 [Oculina patagonica]